MMASSKGKAGGTARKRIAEQIPRSVIPSRVKPTKRRTKRANTPPTLRRRPYDSVSIPQLVYELLNIDKYNRDARGSPERFRTPPPPPPPRRMRGGNRERRRPPYLSEMDRAPESGATSVESLTTTEDVATTDAAYSTAPTSSANSSVSNASTTEEAVATSDSLDNARRVLFERRSLVQLVNSYVKAGIEEGKRQARKYIRKALSFGVRSGYLVPTDPRGNVLRVCPSLVVSGIRRADPESRRKRRVARRGETTTRPTTLDDRRAMRRGIVPTSGDVSPPSATITRSKERRHPVAKPTPSVVRRPVATRRPRRSPGVSTLREKNKRKTTGAQRKRINAKSNDKRGQQRKRGGSEDVGRLPVKRRRAASSPRRVEINREPIERSVRHPMNDDERRFVEGDENNLTRGVIPQTTWISQGRKSSRDEDESRTEKQQAGVATVDDDHRGVIREDDDDKFVGASVQHDANVAIGSTEA